MMVPHPTIQGENWAAYTEQQAILAPVAAQRLGEEVLELVNAIGERERGELCGYADFEGVTTNAENYDCWIFDVKAIQAGLADERRWSHRQRTLIPHLRSLAAFSELVSMRLHITPKDIVINRYPLNGHIAPHQDAGKGMVAAVTLSGNGRMSFRDRSRRITAFDVSAGDLVVINNMAPKLSTRPEHWVWSRTTPRLAFTVGGTPKIYP